MDSLGGDRDSVNRYGVFLPHNNQPTRISHYFRLDLAMETQFFTEIPIITHLSFQQGKDDRLVNVDHGFAMLPEYYIFPLSFHMIQFIIMNVFKD